MKKVHHKIREYIKDLDNKESFYLLTKAMGYTHREAADILNIYIFDDLQFHPHGVVPDAIQSSLNFGDKFISVVGGGTGLYGDGKVSFEVMYSGHEDVESWVDKNRVTEILLELQEDDSD